jgi:hypothetical protein
MASKNTISWSKMNDITLQSIGFYSQYFDDLTSNQRSLQDYSYNFLTERFYVTGGCEGGEYEKLFDALEKDFKKTKTLGSEKRYDILLSSAEDIDEEFEDEDEEYDPTKEFSGFDPTKDYKDETLFSEIGEFRGRKVLKNYLVQNGRKDIIYYVESKIDESGVDPVKLARRNKISK